jgi:hypothetical protein
MSSRPIARSVLGVLLFATCVLASEIDGIWVGQQQGRRGEPEDLAFRFKLDGQALTGTRERVQTAEEKAANRNAGKQTLTLKRFN